MKALEKREQGTSLRVQYRKKMVALLVGICLISFGSSLAIKTNLGVSAWDALGVTISNIMHWRVGDIYLVMNGLCILIQMMIERKNFRKIELLQILNVLLVSVLLNFFVYYLFADLKMLTFKIPIFSYELDVLGILWLAIAYTIISLGVCIVLESKLIRNPLEGVCLLVTDKIGGDMGKFRQKLDILFIIVTFILVTVSKTPLTLREGTVVCMLVFGPMLDVWSKPVRAIMRRFTIA